MYANDFIEFNPGFEAATSGFFESSVYPISIQPCTPSTQKIRKNTQIAGESVLTINKITCSPNPTNNQITFIFTNKEYSRIDLSIFDAFGRLVGNVESLGSVPIGEYSHTYNAENLSNGIYTVIMSEKKLIASSRFIVSK